VKKIYVLDDNRGYLLRLKYILGREYEVHTFSDSMEFIEALNSEKADMIILDYRLSVKDQFDGHVVGLVVREIDPDVPVIVASGYIETEMLDKFKDLNVKRFLRKSFEDYDLIDTVKKYI
jgi:two-component system, cell cycle sensor histidine kinase and response regulator CckA